ncbi:MAG: DUF3108 domain-containing protein [Burkholderiaceae bacterium]
MSHSFPAPPRQHKNDVKRLAEPVVKDMMRREFCTAIGARTVGLVCLGAGLGSLMAASRSSLAGSASGADGQPAIRTIQIDAGNPRSPRTLGSAAPIAAAPARAIRLNYEGYLITGFGNSKIATAVMDFVPKDGRYLMQLTVESMLADLSYSSEGRVDQHGLHPERYIEKRKVAFRSARTKQVQYVVSKDAAAINRFDGGKLTVPPQTQDRLSLMIHLSLVAQANPTLLAPGQEIDIPFARVSAVSSSRWSASEVQPVQLDAGASENDTTHTRRAAPVRPAQRIARVADKKESVDVAFWLSADKDRLPLVLQFSENGRSLKFVTRD